MLVETPSPRHVSSRSRVGISSPLRFHHSFGSGLLYGVAFVMACVSGGGWGWGCGWAGGESGVP
jgi:hypothetical protein